MHQYYCGSLHCIIIIIIIILHDGNLFSSSSATLFVCLYYCNPMIIAVSSVFVLFIFCSLLYIIVLFRLFTIISYTEI